MERYRKLTAMLAQKERIAIAYSGGADSMLLLRAACDAVGCKNVLAITAHGVLNTAEELFHAKDMAEKMSVQHKIIDIDFLSIPEVESNSPLRCYFCKKQIFKKIIQIANDNKFDVICDGSNASDDATYRPGMRVLSELGIISPLLECGLTKSDVYELLTIFGILVSPSNSCLATRIPYNTKLDAEILNKVYIAEKLMHEAGFSICRVRIHNDSARIVIPKDKFIHFLSMTQLHKSVKQIGFTSISLDLDGYKSSC